LFAPGLATIPFAQKPPKAYIFTIASNIYLEQRRKKKNEVALEDVYQDPAPGPDKLLEVQLKLFQQTWLME